MIAKVFPIFLLAGLMASDVLLADASPNIQEVEAALARGTEFLIERQNPAGSWGSARNTKGLNIYAPIPGAHHGFRGATTALCVDALIQCADWRNDERARKAIELGEDWLLENLPKIRRANSDALYNVWAHIYGLQALATMYERSSGDGPRKDKIREVIHTQFELLQRYESVDGGWGYYDFRYQTKRPSSSSISFVNAAGLVALHDIEKKTGIKAPQKLVQRAYDATQRQRNSNNTFHYGEYLSKQPVREINRSAGSLGRSQSCIIALRLWGDETMTTEVVCEWLQRLNDRNFWLDIGRKRPIPHESWAAVAGYFFYFGHFYAGRCVVDLPAESGAEFGPLVAGLVMRHQEKDGSWWDYPFYDYHQQYGTAYALLTLRDCLSKFSPSPTGPLSAEDGVRELKESR